MIELIQSQLLDPFRIGLIVALVFTMFRTRAATGTFIPLTAGVIFVAVILPATQSPGQGSGAASLTEAVAARRQVERSPRMPWSASRGSEAGMAWRFRVSRMASLPLGGVVQGSRTGRHGPPRRHSDHLM